MPSTLTWLSSQFSCDEMESAASDASHVEHSISAGEITSNERLLAALRQRQAWAFRLVYELYAVDVRRLVIRLVGDAMTAEDIVHDAFVALPDALDRFRQDASLKTFLCSIALRKALRHKGRRQSVEFENQMAPVQSHTPEVDVERAQLAKELEEALSGLPKEQRAVFVLCDVEGRSSQEVSEIVGASDGTVRARLMHARKKLRVELAKRGVR